MNEMPVRQPERPRNGLGLPIARHTVLTHGGDLTAASPGRRGVRGVPDQ